MFIKLIALLGCLAFCGQVSGGEANIETRSVDGGRKNGVSGLPELLFNREVTLSDAEQYFYKNIFTYLDTKFKLLDGRITGLNHLNKSIDQLKSEILGAHAECVQSLKGQTEIARSLQEMDLKKYRIFPDYEIQPEFHAQYMLSSLLFKNASADSYLTCLSECDRSSKCLVTVIKPSECHLYSNELVFKHVKLAKSSSLFRDDNDQINSLTRIG
jgi:hypothetical protein